MIIDSQIVTAFLTGVVGPLAAIYLKQRYDKKKGKPDMLADALEVSSLITSKIEQIRNENHADRVWITQFHNGGHFYPTGKSMAKFSMIYETVNANAVSIQGGFQNIPVNLFSKSINELLINEVIEIPDFKDETISTFGLKYIAEESGCKSGYLFAIKTIEGKFIGIMGVDFTKKKVKLDDESVNDLLVHASKIGGVLMGNLEH